MFTIQNYDSRLAISDYRIGEVYSFYIHNPNMNRLVTVNETDFAPFVTRLTDILETNEGVIKNNGQYLNFTESVGIVIDTHKSTSPKEIDYITVLFQTASNDFAVNKYVVNYNRTSI